jgi:predicted O-linked N-acetylglucosamine transferase (SPINDLY family)
MSQPVTIDQAFSIALQHHQAGRLPEAEALYRQILAAAPNSPDALHMLGVLAIQTGHLQQAIDLIQHALQIHPSITKAVAPYYSNLAQAYHKQADYDTAITLCRRALELDPNFGDAAFNLINALTAANRFEEALAAAERRLAIAFNDVTMLRHKGDLLVRLHKLEQALPAYQQSLHLDPRNHEARHNYGVALAFLGRPDLACEQFREALKSRPNDIDTLMALAEASSRVNRPPDALAAYARVLQLDPNNADAHAGQAVEYRGMGQLDEAVAAYDRALAIKPNHATYLVNLALAYRDAGDLDHAGDYFRQAIAADPQNAAIHSAYVMTLYVQPNATPDQIAAEHASWNARHAAPLPKFHHAPVNESLTRPLRVGYVSADLRHHPVGRFMAPIFDHHDCSQVQVFCYSVAHRLDAAAAGFQKKPHITWRNVAALTPEELANQIHADKIDILVDLSMHTIDNALLAFARKPAPIQMTYLAYCASTGLETIDYRLTDAIIDPPFPQDQSLPFEKPLRLETYWCYAPHADAPAVAPLPALANGFITLGSFNYFSKLNPQLLAAWADLLQALPNSHLTLHAPQGTAESRLRTFFESRQIAPERLILFPRTSEAQYFAHYNAIDIALDPFPFSGGTTTCDALFMGVPVITRTGPLTTSHGTASILTTLGLQDLITTDWPAYHAAVLSLASDLPRLQHLRQTLRQTMQSSPLMNPARFTQKLESLYRLAWQNYLATQPR